MTAGVIAEAAARRMIAGQYLTFTSILAVAIALTFGPRFLPKEALPYLGLLPIALGLRDAWKAWRTASPVTAASALAPHQLAVPHRQPVGVHYHARREDQLHVAAVHPQVDDQLRSTASLPSLSRSGASPGAGRSVADTWVSSLSLDFCRTPDYTLMQ